MITAAAIAVMIIGGLGFIGLIVLGIIDSFS